MKKFVMLILLLCIVLWADNEIDLPTLKSKSNPVVQKIASGKTLINLNGRGELLFDQSPTGFYRLYSCQWDSIYPFWSETADNFTVPFDTWIDSLVWWGDCWGGIGNIIDFWIKIYPDSSVGGSAAWSGAELQYHQPKQDPIYEERYDNFTETDIGDYCQYELYLTTPFTADDAEIYWIVFQPTLIFPPQWGNLGSYPSNNPGWGDGQMGYFKSDFFGYPEWVSANIAWGEPAETSFQIWLSDQAGITESSTDAINENILSVNPTIGNQTTTISFSITSPSLVSLNLYNSVGQNVKTLFDGKATTGTHTVNLPLRELPAGIYFVSLQINETSITQELIVTR